MHDVLRAFHAVSDTGTLSYYACPVDPTSTDGLIRSHFKGIASFAGKLIFTHTNLAGDGAFGKYLIADKPDAGAQGTVDATFETQPEGWCHPCSAQACGSFMAMGIQEAEDSSSSLIQICDLQNTQDKQRMVVLSSFAVDGGINGVGMTREVGPDGRYLVAGVNGNSLTLYRSASSTLLPGQIDFAPVYHTYQFAESGAGLALVTQTDGRIFLFTLNADDDGAHNEMCLYSIDLAAGIPLSKLAQRAMTVPGVSQSLTDALSYMLNNQTPLGQRGDSVAVVSCRDLHEQQLPLGQGSRDHIARLGHGLRLRPQCAAAVTYDAGAPGLLAGGVELTAAGAAVRVQCGCR
ncbi:hypothetical protein ACFFTM_16805 [Pseudoduganella plicata]|uniref:3-carboxymuconate cyclase n=1 Tax=Pseudoduganella plicata TaxID=321984 RepID=A0A4P7BMI2_9BURK|nr:hypothetical protein [Pseudoduganella plicata]QBQ38955.1 hypothetical protein E1742_24475 [Pseudoduganella plicata]GGY86039.1 hypothetical protein GCM10007388_18950 [Pseudoduganella plicata]